MIVEEVPSESLALFNENTTYVFNEGLSPVIQEEIKGWDEYTALSKFLKKNYISISPALSLEMSKELTDLSKAMNDSLRIIELNNREMFARLNVFYSEALRLKDMSQISSIKPSEVTEQVEKLVSVYNSINMKIKSIYLQKSFDSDVSFDESVFEFNESSVVPYSKPKKPKRQKPTQNGKPSFRK